MSSRHATDQLWLVPKHHERKWGKVKKKHSHSAEWSMVNAFNWPCCYSIVEPRHRPFVKITMYYIVCHYHFSFRCISLSFSRTLCATSCFPFFSSSNFTLTDVESVSESVYTLATQHVSSPDWYLYTDGLKREKNATRHNCHLSNMIELLFKSLFAYAMAGSV